MNDMLIRHQLEECKPVREYKASLLIKLMQDESRLPIGPDKLRALREADQQTDKVVNEVLAVIKTNRFYFCRDHCWLYQIREDRINKIIKQLNH
ncbi:hypothetical protein [Lacticaseibacillus paracasei]|uniref:Uncharacterized protein n=1 Tax=Lacticaseibacillus paracasei NRIC 0644 TaxID=1435038 RepID=A0A0C9PZ96_LACPA|nr:hypothetical protein [Lacticaseibacillus paracasei]EKP99624.2 hypothetical protein LCA12A_1299 [Lacticaseibacillus casei 12A]GAN37539.1 hypothetical protein LC0644_2128 [Lacticaseibacillus paracasei NRIC 0644]GAN38862.1 hypothetical protein LC1917_0739 [Lacticaseibacillus paracasei NRIC 1917]